MSICIRFFKVENKNDFFWKKKCGWPIFPWSFSLFGVITGYLGTKIQSMLHHKEFILIYHFLTVFFVQNFILYFQENQANFRASNCLEMNSFLIEAMRRCWREKRGALHANCSSAKFPEQCCGCPPARPPLPLKYLSHHPTVSVSDDIQYYVTVKGLHQCFSTRSASMFQPVGV